jgi:hypothetical protein
MVDNSENILVEFDYNNITIIDPNKVVDSLGNVKERNVKHEDLVMYANLECDVLPRTKLAIGSANNDAIRTVSIAKINFLNPGSKGVLDNSYTDEITGTNSIKGEGVNQPKQTSIRNPDKSDDFYIKQTINSGGKAGSTDNGLLGITSIQIRQGLDFLPTFTIRLTDIKGRALFEGADNSPYAAFFNLPYPLFHLTIKGFYGKAVRLGLMLQNFHTTYDSNTGNFNVDLTFYTYKYTVLSEITMGALMATPHMYQSRLKIQSSSGGPNSTTKVDDVVVEGGYQKIREMYSEYKSKGLIPDNFPEITLIQLKERLENFIKNVLDTFTKQNLTPLTRLEDYSNYLGKYQGDVFYYAKDSWFEKFMDKDNYYMLKDNLTKVYTFKKEFNAQKKSDALSDLNGIIDKYKGLLDTNETCGVNGKYTINNKTVTCSIPNDVQLGIFEKSITIEDVNLLETYKIQRKNSQPLTKDLDAFKAELIKNNIFNNVSITLGGGGQVIKSQYFVFEGEGSFIDLTNKMGKVLKTKQEEIQEELTLALADLLQSAGKNGIGFIPTIRNVLAVVFANGEAFLRLMDDVHFKAWEQRNSEIRKSVIFDKQIASASADNKDSGDDLTQPVYPWPQVIKETSGDKDQEKYELRYPGDNDIINQTKGFLTDVWPEIEFVEEFLRGFVQRESPPTDLTANSNELTETKRISLDAIEFPIGNLVFNNKEEVKFFYEIYERVFLTSHYSRLSRSEYTVSDSDKVSNIVADAESINLKFSLGGTNPFLIKKLKEYGFNSTNFEALLRHISNEGIGISWQNYIRGIFNTGYIKNIVENGSFEFINSSVLLDTKTQPQVSLANETQIVDYISNSTTTNVYDFADIYPFTNKTWVKGGLANGKSTDELLCFNTTKSLTYNTNKKVISNFTGSGTEKDDIKKPITNFVYKTITDPTNDVIEVRDGINTLNNFYSNRTYKNQLPTEGDVKYSNYSGGVGSHQTTSMLNTPYFINSIQEGIQNFRNGDIHPFVSSAYLFINSLPLSTLREKYKTYENSSQTDLDYIFASLKKFGAIHKMPYSWVLKFGSIWYRYKKYVNDGVDILNKSWSGFSATNNYDPVTNDPSKTYYLTINGSNIDIILEKDTLSNIGNVTTIINTGFYPKVINDFNVFYQGFNIYSGYTNADIQSGFNSGVTMNYVPEAIINNVIGNGTSNTKNIRVIPWSVYVKSFDGEFSYIIPSQGSLINQTKEECFSANGDLKIEISGNTAMYNGSVRMFWAAPNYGYFDTNKLIKPTPEQYLKQVFFEQDDQENFSINGVSNDYTKISEIFSVFDKSVLDKFETEFLNFSKSIYDYTDDVTVNNTNTEKSFKNFQMLMREMMKFPNIKDLTNTLAVTDIQGSQLTILSNLVTQFLNYNIVFKYGNPSNFDKKLFYTFSQHNIEDPVTWGPYNTATQTMLPPSNSLEWKALRTYVGFSEIPELSYKNSGSYITDFFIDCNVGFSVDNIIKLTPIIKIYATQKLKDNTLNYNKFVKLTNDYLNGIDRFNDKIINNLMIKIQKLLPDVNNSPQERLVTVLDSTQSKVELWESFKATNDKWISGNDFKTKTLFEDVLLMDRASRDVGDKILVDVIKLKDRLTDINVKTNMLTYVQTILVENNFVVMNIPSYVNFYNVQDVVKNAIPKPEGTLEFANTMFGTFLNVDYRNSSAKMVCFYGGKPSEQLDLKNNVDYRYRNDAFDLRRASDNPLLENQIGKNDWAKSNKVVGFNVDIGPQNQAMFHGFNVSQNPGQSTAESLEVINQMANQSGNRGGSTQSLSLYNVYKNRSYECTVTMMGNAMIQPTMYFNLRYVPMFSGPYMIQTVNHTITPGVFETVFTGIRQPTASLPKVENYLQSLKTTLLKTIVDKNKKDREDKKMANEVKSTNVVKDVSNTVKELTDKDNTKNSTTQTCEPIDTYDKYVVETPINTTSTYSDMVKLIMSKTNDKKLRYIIFSAIYLNSSNGNGLQSKSNNYAGIDLSQNWGQAGLEYFSNNYYCSAKRNIPYVFFNSVETHINFLISRNKDRLSLIDDGTSKVDIAKFNILYSEAELKDPNVYTTMNPTDKSNIESSVQSSINIFKAIEN